MPRWALPTQARDASPEAAELWTIPAGIEEEPAEPCGITIPAPERPVGFVASTDRQTCRRDWPPTTSTATRKEETGEPRTGASTRVAPTNRTARSRGAGT